MTTTLQCPACRAQGLTSQVKDQGTTAHLLGWQPYYDEAGVQHRHNPNRHCTFYLCSQGHQFERVYYQACPSCGYVREAERILEFKQPCGVKAMPLTVKKV